MVFLKARSTLPLLQRIDNRPVNTLNHPVTSCFYRTHYIYFHLMTRSADIKNDKDDDPKNTDLFCINHHADPGIRILYQLISKCGIATKLRTPRETINN
jgi:hypothetical protein